MVSQFDDVKLSMTNGLFEQGRLNTLKQHANYTCEFSQHLILQIERSREIMGHMQYTDKVLTDNWTILPKSCLH